MSLRVACCAAAGIDPDSSRGQTVDRASAIANDWYGTHPMPCGCKASEEKHHQACAAHVGREVRCGCGLIAFLSIWSCLLSICYTVWSWRHTIDHDRKEEQALERENIKRELEIEQLERDLARERRSHND
jgi:hypothetical protein